jgi:acyl carrier protein
MIHEFCLRIAEALDVAAVIESDVLPDFPEWDSLSVLSIIAMLDSKYGVNLTATDLKGVRTPTDLWTLVLSRQAP